MAGSPMPMSVGSTLLCFPGEAKGPFSWERCNWLRVGSAPPPAAGIEGWGKEGILLSPVLPRGRQEGRDQLSHSHSLGASSPISETSFVLCRWDLDVWPGGQYDICISPSLSSSNLLPSCTHDSFCLSLPYDPHRVPHSWLKLPLPVTCHYRGLLLLLCLCHRTTHHELGLAHQSLIKKMYHRLAPKPIRQGDFLSWGSQFSNDFNLNIYIYINS